jgi:hypothetical protein
LRSIPKDQDLRSTTFEARKGERLEENQGLSSCVKGKEREIE